MILTDDEAIAKVKDHAGELSKRAAKFRQLERYVEGPCPLPQSIVHARVTKAYRMLMGMAETPYGRKVIKSATSRMEVGGVRSGDETVDRALWDVWQSNHMDAESKRAHDTILTHGRAFGLVWTKGDRVTMKVETPDTMIVEYVEGDRYERVAASRHWVDDAGKSHATLYMPDAVYKFTGEQGGKWGRRLVDDELWPLPNPKDVVPVVEIATGRSLKAGRFGTTTSDLDGALGLLDRINVLEFLRLVIAFTAGFPVRVVVGGEILRDDDNNPIAPFELAADVVAHLEDPNVKVHELKAADLKAFGDAIDHDVQILAAITSTPSQKLQALPIQNVSADAIRATDQDLNDRVNDHQPQVGEGWEEFLRVAGVMLEEPVELAETAELVWVNRESRSIAERADAAVKLQAAGFPWQAVMEIVFDATQGEVTRWEAMRGSDALSSLLAAPPVAGALPVGRPPNPPPA